MLRCFDVCLSVELSVFVRLSVEETKQRSGTLATTCCFASVVVHCGWQSRAREACQRWWQAPRAPKNVARTLGAETLSEEHEKSELETQRRAPTTAVEVPAYSVPCTSGRTQECGAQCAPRASTGRVKALKITG